MTSRDCRSEYSANVYLSVNPKLALAFPEFQGKPTPKRVIKQANKAGGIVAFILRLFAAK